MAPLKHISIVAIAAILLAMACGKLSRKRDDSDEGAQAKPTEDGTDTGDELGEDAGSPEKPEKPEDPECSREEHDAELRKLAEGFIDREKRLHCATDDDCVLVTPPCFAECQIAASYASKFPDFVVSEGVQSYCQTLLDKGCSTKDLEPKLCLNSTKTRCIESRCVGYDDSVSPTECALLQNRMRAAYPSEDLRTNLEDVRCERDADCSLALGPSDVLCKGDPSYAILTKARTEAFEAEIATLSAKLKSVCLDEGAFDPKMDCGERSKTPVARCHATQKVCTTVWE